MGWYGDPDEIDRLAARLGADADRVRAEARDAGAAARSATWRGEAAEAFQSAVRDDMAAALEAARRLDEAAGALRQHAVEVREVLARIRAVEAAVTGWFADRVRDVQRAADAVASGVRDAAGDAARVVQTPPWSGWEWRPDRLPEPGSSEWLDAGAFLRRQGVLV